MAGVLDRTRPLAAPLIHNIPHRSNGSSLHPVKITTEACYSASEERKQMQAQPLKLRGELLPSFSLQLNIYKYFARSARRRHLYSTTTSGVALWFRVTRCCPTSNRVSFDSILEISPFEKGTCQELVAVTVFTSHQYNTVSTRAIRRLLVPDAH